MYKKNLQELLKEKPWLRVGLMNETYFYCIEVMLTEEKKELLNKILIRDKYAFETNFLKLFKKAVTELPVKDAERPDNYRNSS